MLQQFNKLYHEIVQRNSSYLLVILKYYVFILDAVRLFSFSLLTLSGMLQTPKSTVEVKELKVDISKDGGSGSNLFVRLHILPILVHIGEPRVICDQLSNFSGGGCSSSGQASIASTEKSSAPFVCEKVSISCEFGHDRYISSLHTFF